MRAGSKSATESFRLSRLAPVRPVDAWTFVTRLEAERRNCAGQPEMLAKNNDLHGNVPDASPVALLLIDVINDLEFENNQSLLRQAKLMAARIARLKERARRARIPAIYVNDNFGRWQSDFHKQIDHCLHDNVCGQFLAEKLRPEPDDYFVLKPKHSGFFSTTLDIVLRYLKVH